MLSCIGERIDLEHNQKKYLEQNKFLFKIFNKNIIKL